jgi:ferredoxin
LAINKEAGKMTRLRYLENVVTLQLAKDKCIGCGRCVEVCPHAVFSMNETKAKLVDRNACMECGACTQNCPTAAITVKSGVGCAAAVLKSYLSGKAPSCGCDDTTKTPTNSFAEDKRIADSCCDTQNSSCC